MRATRSSGGLLLAASVALSALLSVPTSACAQNTNPYGYGYRNYGYGYGPVYGYGAYGYGTPYGYGYGTGYGGNWGDQVAWELKEQAETKADNIRSYDQSMQSAAETKLLQEKARQLQLQNQYQSRLLQQKSPAQQAQLSSEQQQMAKLLAEMEKKAPAAKAVPVEGSAKPAATATATATSDPATADPAAARKMASPADARKAPAAPSIISIAVQSGKPINWPDALRRPMFDSNRRTIDTLVASLRNATPANQLHLRSQLRYQIAQMSYHLQANRTQIPTTDYAAGLAFLKQLSLATW